MLDVYCVYLIIKIIIVRHKNAYICIKCGEVVQEEHQTQPTATATLILSFMLHC